MLTHADDFRIMTEVDMITVKRLSGLSRESGSTRQEARLMAGMRLLVAHIAGITDGTIEFVEALNTKRDPPRNDMTDVYDEGHTACREDVLKFLRGEKC